MSGRMCEVYLCTINSGVILKITQKILELITSIEVIFLSRLLCGYKTIKFILNQLLYIFSSLVMDDEVL